MSAEFDLKRELDAFGIGDEERASLARMWKYISLHMDDLLDDFYAGVLADPHTARFFEDEVILKHARDKQVAHWGLLFAGDFSDDYLRSTDLIGQVHFRIKLPFVDYMSAYAKIGSALQCLMIKRLSGRFGIARVDSMLKVVDVIQRAVSLDMQLVMEAYFQAQARERQEAFDEMSKGIEKMMGDDMTYHLGDDWLGELPEWFRGIERGYDALRSRLSQVIGEMSASAEQAGETAVSVNGRADELAERSERQAATLEESVAALQELEQTVRGTADLAKSAQTASDSNRREAETGAEVVRDTQNAMNQIEDSSKQIGHIVDVIDEISFQTNLLALNAGVEAARAGEAGRGFAVVATEVRELAARASSSAKEIRSLIESSQNHVRQGSDLVSRTGQALTEILTHVGEVSNLVSEIASVTQDQAMTMESVNNGMTDLEKETSANATIASQVNESALMMRNRSDKVVTRLRQFRLPNGGSRAEVELEAGDGNEDQGRFAAE